MGRCTLILLVAMTGCRSILGIDSPNEISPDAPGGHGHPDGALDVLDGPAMVDAFVPLVDAPPGAPAAVQAAYGDPSGDVQTVMTTFSVGQTAGNFNVIAIGWLDTNNSVKTVTDTAGSVYLPATTAVSHNGTRQQMFYAYVAKTGANTITVQFDGQASYPDARAAEYVNIATSNPIDDTATGTGNSTMCDSGLLTTTSPTDLLVASNVMTVYTQAAGTGYTVRSLSQPDQDVLEDQVVTQPGDYRAQAMLDGQSQWSMQLVAFKGR